ncbi:hypothetical protein GGX14DRAFT_629518 [Mycena pura]|uniref:Uncharacterized protein n=1 Tax=Mycena pura TaxID=153505 RepID=A0AAD6YRR4_9AGAR|nr:hypothetical protein GGX14DRAFT_629518 [Mycena pura]
MMLRLGGYLPSSYVSILAVYLYTASDGPLPQVVAGEFAPNHLRTARCRSGGHCPWHPRLEMPPLTFVQAFLLHHLQADANLARPIKCRTYLLQASCAWRPFLSREEAGFSEWEGDAETDPDSNSLRRTSTPKYLMR